MNIVTFAVKGLRVVDRFFRVQGAMRALSRSGQIVVYADIGSAGGIPTYYRRASQRGLLSLLLFDPQDDWRRRQNRTEYGGCDVRYVKAALGRKSETRPFYVTAAPACSSCLLPNDLVLSRFPVREWLRVVSREEISVRPYQELHLELGLRAPDIVKIDVQGLELEVLAGFGRLLDDVTCVELEVNFEQLYVGQPVICEVYQFMRGQGFVLRDLQPQGPFEGQAMEYNSFWSRRNLTEAQQRTVTLWESIHDIWPGLYFSEADSRARQNARFG